MKANSHKFQIADKVRVVSNPYGQMLPGVTPGMQATVTSPGTNIVALDFGATKVKAWLVVDGHGKTTIERA
jgi:hypothetical protein